MSLVNPSQSNAGDTIEAADINTPVNQLAAVINGNIDSTNIAANGVTATQLADSAATPSKLQAGTGASWVWQTWTPTVTAATGTFTTATGTGRYIQIGKTIVYRADLTITSIGTGTGCSFTLPVTAQTSAAVLGVAREDATSGNMGVVKFMSTTTATVSRYDNGNISSGGSGSIVRVSGSYEAA